MSSRRQPVRVSTQRPSVPQRSDGRLLLGVGFFGISAVFGFIVAIATDELSLRVVMAGVAVFAVLAVFYIRALHDSWAPGTVGLSSDGSLTFVPGVGLRMLPFVIALTAIVTVTWAFVIDPSVIEGGPRRGIPMLWVAGVAWLIQQLFSLRHPAGLRVTPVGLEGVRGAGDRRYSWEQLGAAKPATDAEGRAIFLEDVYGLSAGVGARHIGSDPAVVAVIIEHFLQHPDDRHLVTDARAAIRRVEDAHEREGSDDVAP